jgi:hypothetical protein
VYLAFLGVVEPNALVDVGKTTTRRNVVILSGDVPSEIK